MLKTWLREHAMDRDIPAKEVQVPFLSSLSRPLRLMNGVDDHVAP